MKSCSPGGKIWSRMFGTVLLMLIINVPLLSNNQLKESFFHNYTTDHGLPHPLCQCIEEDSHGYIWVGTPAGLVRYDGVYFELFNDTNTELTENNITALHQNKKQNLLWVGTKNGSIFTVDNNTNTFHPLPYAPGNINTTGIGQIRHLYQYNDSILLVATNRNGLLKINTQTGNTSYINQQSNHPIQHLQINNIRLVHGKLFIAAKQGIFTIQEQNDALCLKPTNKSPHNAADLVEESDSTLFVAVKNTLYRFNIKSRQLDVLKHFPDPISRIIYLPSQMVWLSTRTNGLYLYNTQENIVQHHTVGNSRYSLQDNNIYALVESKRNNIIWIGTKNGLSKFDNRHNNIRYFDLNQFSDSKSANIFMIKKDSKNNYWIWSTDGLYRKGYNQNKFERIPPSPTYPNRDSILHCIETRKNGLLFASTQGVLHYKPENNHFEYLPLKNKDTYFHLTALSDTSYCFLSTNMFVIYNCQKNEERRHSIKQYNNIRLQNSCRDGDSLLWIGSNHGLLFRYHLPSGHITDTLRIPANEKLLSLAAITALQLDGQQNLWIATQGSGLFKYNIPKKQFSPVKTSNQTTENIYILEKDHHGDMWLTNSQGIVKINTRTGQQDLFSYNFYILPEEYNQGASAVSASGDILMGGANGFNEVNPDNQQTQQYNQTPIVTSCILLPGSAFSFENRNQKTIYNPRDTIFIPKEYESIRLHVRFLNFLNSKKAKIAWKIDQIDSDWQNSTVASPVIYSNIPPGKNKMTIVALDDNNNPTGAPVHIVIKKEVYFFRHPAFKTAVIILAFFMVILLFILRNKKLVKQRLKLNLMVAEKTNELVEANKELIQSKEKITIQNEELEIHRVYLEELVKIRTADLEKAKQKAEESDKLKTAFLANLSHEIRTPMNCIMGFTTLLSSDLFSDQEKKEFVQHIQNSSESLLVLINDIIDISRIETHQIKLIQSDLNIESDLTQIVRSLKFEKTETISEIKIDVDPSCKNRTLVTDKERFKQITQNLINNAIKFTKNGQIELSARIIQKKELKNHHYNGLPTTEETKVLLISVADHGIGIAPENQQLIFEPFRKVDNKEVLYPGIGLGLSIVKNLTELLEGEVWVKSEVGKGSTFYFYIPAR